MNLKKISAQLFKIHLGGIKNDFHGFHMAGLPGTDLAVGRIHREASSIAVRRADDTGNPAHQLLDPPETASGKDGALKTAAILWFKLQRYGINAVTGIFHGQPLPLENMSEMSTAAGTTNLGTPSIGVRQTLHCSGNSVIEGGPAA